MVCEMISCLDATRLVVKPCTNSRPMLRQMPAAKTAGTRNHMPRRVSSRLLPPSARNVSGTKAAMFATVSAGLQRVGAPRGSG